MWSYVLILGPCVPLLRDLVASVKCHVLAIPALTSLKQKREHPKRTPAVAPSLIQESLPIKETNAAERAVTVSWDGKFASPVVIAKTGDTRSTLPGFE